MLVALAAGALAAVPPLGHPIVDGDHAETAIYVTLDGASRRVDGAQSAPSYPEGMRRLQLEADVVVTCARPAACAVASAAPALEQPPAIAAASLLATADRAYPLPMLVSFRVLSQDTTHLIVHWAPQTCPPPGQPPAKVECIEALHRSP